MRTSAKLQLESVEGEGLRFRAGAGAGAGDGPTIVVDSGPGAQGPNPMVVLLASLGACSGMDIIGVLRKKRQVVTGYEIELVGERNDEHPRRYTSIEVVHRLRGPDLSPQAIEDALRLSDTKYCSVHATLEDCVAITSRFEIVPEA